jgi:hypothetical protein
MISNHPWIKDLPFEDRLRFQLLYGRCRYWFWKSDWLVAKKDQWKQSPSKPTND